MGPHFVGSIYSTAAVNGLMIQSHLATIELHIP